MTGFTALLATLNLPVGCSYVVVGATQSGLVALLTSSLRWTIVRFCIEFMICFICQCLTIVYHCSAQDADDANAVYQVDSDEVYDVVVEVVSIDEKAPLRLTSSKPLHACTSV